MASAWRLLAAVALFVRDGEAHGHMTYPESSRQGGQISLGGDCDGSQGACYWFTNNVQVLVSPTLSQAFRSVNTAVSSGPLDWSRQNPWRAPGRAVVLGSGCGVAGGGPTYYTNGGQPPKGIKQGMDGVHLPEKKAVVWPRGSVQEVGMAVTANHAGGYSWRLCKKDRKMSEECFQQTTLNFAGDTQYIVYTDGKWSQIPLKKTTEGTYPPGSEWARFPIPSCLDCNPAEKCGKPLPATPGKDPTSEWNTQVNCNAACAGSGSSKQAGTCSGNTQFQPPLKDASGFGKSIWDWSIVDRVAVPADIKEGDYLLSFRWDCEQSDQVFQNCADVEITIGGEGPATLLDPANELMNYRRKPRSDKKKCDGQDGLYNEECKEGDTKKDSDEDGEKCKNLGINNCESNPNCEVMKSKPVCYLKGYEAKMMKDVSKDDDKSKSKEPEPEPEPEPDSSSTATRSEVPALLCVLFGVAATQ